MDYETKRLVDIVKNYYESYLNYLRAKRKEILAELRNIAAAALYENALSNPQEVGKILLLLKEELMEYEKKHHELTRKYKQLLIEYENASSSRDVIENLVKQLKVIDELIRLVAWMVNKVNEKTSLSYG